MQRLSYNLLFSCLVLPLTIGFAVEACAFDRSAKVDSRIPLAQLEQRQSSAEAELQQLAKMTFRGGVGNLGWESRICKSSDQSQKPQWLEVRFDQEHFIDQIVLVPMLAQSRDGAIQSVGFPRSFKVLLGSEQDQEGHVVSACDDTNCMLPRSEPVVLPLSPTRASWLRIEVPKLSPIDDSDERFQVQLSEVIAFSGEENVALRAEAKVSSVRNNRVSKAINAQGLVDGFTPYLMAASEGSGNQGCVFFFHAGPQAALTFDLGQPRKVNRIHLHSAHRREKVPQLHHADYAMPDHFVIKGSNDLDFSDAVELYEFRKNSIYDSGPILISRFSECECRFVRIVAIESYKAPEARKKYCCFGFAEVEILEDGKNVAAGVLPMLNIQQVSRDGKPWMLTDGQNEFGFILSQREWISQLARRYELERTIRDLESIRIQRYSQQTKYFKFAMAAIAALALVVVGIVVTTRTARKRELEKLQNRFAADLHDEVGADLHAISLLSELAKTEINGHASANMNSLLDEIRNVTADASRSVRQISEAQTEAPYAKLVDLMNQWAKRILIGIKHELVVVGEEHISGLSPKRKSQVLLFFKECLVNASRHAEATRLKTTLTATTNKVSLKVEDNGKGMTSAASSIPPSLARRAKLLGAQISTESAEDEGTTVLMEFSRKQWGFLQ